MESLFYWTGALIVCGLMVLFLSWIWFLALRQLQRSMRETYLMADLILWARRRKSRRERRNKERGKK